MPHITRRRLHIGLREMTSSSTVSEEKQPPHASLRRACRDVLVNRCGVRGWPRGCSIDGRRSATTSRPSPMRCGRSCCRYPDQAVNRRIFDRLAREPLDDQIVQAAIAHQKQLQQGFADQLRTLSARAGERSGLSAAILGEMKPMEKRFSLRNEISRPSGCCSRLPSLPARYCRSSRSMLSRRRAMQAVRGRRSYISSAKTVPQLFSWCWPRHPGQMLVLGSRWGEFAALQPEVKDSQADLLREILRDRSGYR